jgi:hypothetical protein
MKNVRSRIEKLGLGKPKINFGSISLSTKQILIYSIVTTLLLSSSGVVLSDSILLCGALIVQWIPGALVWKSLRQDCRVLFTELLGMGMAIGILLALLSSQIFRLTPLGSLSWAIPFLMSTSFALYTWFQTRNKTVVERLELPSKQLIKSLFPSLVFGIIQLSVWWRWHPLEWSGWWKYNVDVPYFESYSNSLALLGTSQNLMGSISETRYHWFVYAWVGSLTDSLQIDSFVVLTRLLPIVAMIMGATIAYSWVFAKTSHYWAAGLASLVIIIGPGLSIGSFVMLRSPSSAISVGLSLAFTFLLFEVIDGSIKHRAGYVILSLLAVGIVGGKATSTVLAVGAVGVLVLLSNTQDHQTRKRIWLAGSVSLISLCLAYQLLISSSESRRLGFGFYLGWPGLFLTLIPMVSGLFILLKGKRQYGFQYVTFCFCILTIGAVLSLITFDSSGNQIYFFLSAATICVVPGVIGLNHLLCPKGLKTEKETTPSIFVNPKFLFVIILSGLTSSFAWSIFENSTSSTGKIARTLVPVISWLACGTYAMLSARLPSSEQSWTRRFLYFLIPALLASSLTSSGLNILFSTIKGPIYADSSGVLSFGESEFGAPGAISYEYVLAGKWVQRHTPKDAVFFSNRQCLNVDTHIERCDGLWTYASALSRRQFIIEGSAYFAMSQSKFDAILRDQKLSIRFPENLNESDWGELWERGARWGWIDRQVSKRTEWGKFAKEVFRNKNVIVIRLEEPESPINK